MNKILKHTALFSVFVLLAQVLGLVRDLYLARVFGVGQILDTYYLAFKIPDFLNIFYSVFLGSVIFIPLLTKAKHAGGEEDNRREIVKNVNLVGSLVLTLLISFFIILFVFMNFFAGLLVPAWNAEQKDLLINLSRILLVAQFFFPIGILAGCIGMVYQKPLGMALSGFVYNAGILLLATILVPLFGIYGLAYSVVFSAILFMLVQVWNKEVVDIYRKYKYIFNFNEWLKFIKQNLGRFFAVLSYQLYGILLLYIAGLSGTGNISAFSISYNIYLAGFFVLGASFSTALMPKISEHHVKNEKEELRKNLRKSIFYIFIISFLAGLILFFGSYLIIKILYHFSSLGEDKEIFISTLLAMLANSFPFFNVLEVVRKYLYSTGQIFWAGSLTVFMLASVSLLTYILTLYSTKPLITLLIFAMNISIFLATVMILFVLKLKKQI